MACACCWSAMNPATSRSCTTSRRACCVDVAKRFTKDCHELGIVGPRHLHPGPAGRDPRDDRGDPALRQGDQSAYHPGVAGRALSRHLPLQAGQGKWLVRQRCRSVDRRRHADRAAATIPIFGHTEIFDSVEDFYKKFYFRPSKIIEIVKEMLTSRDMLVRRLREGVEFFQFLKNREDMIVS